MQGPVCIIANAGSGKKRAAEIDSLLGPLTEHLGAAPTLKLIEHGRDLAPAARAAAKEGFRTVIAAGGDGTVCAVASELVGSDIAMGVLPMGTFNYFSRSLGFPQEPAEALKVLIEADTRRISVGDINGRLFLNNASLGLYAAILRDREQIYDRWGRSRVAAYWSVLRTILTFRRPSMMKLTIDGETQRRRTPMVFVAANGYQLDEFSLPGKTCLAEGKFAVFLAPDSSRWELVRFAARLAMGAAVASKDFDLLCGADVTIETRRARRTIARDGERDTMSSPFRFRMLNGALAVLAPPEVPEESAAHVSNRIAAEATPTATPTSPAG